MKTLVYSAIQSVCIGLLFLSSNQAFADDRVCTFDISVASFESIQGSADVNQLPAQNTDLVCAGDTIDIGPHSRATIRLSATDTVIRLNQNTRLQIPRTPAERHSVLNLLKGIIYLFSREPRAIDINTIYANAAVEGTEFVVQVSSGQTRVTVLEGKVRTYNDTGEITLSSNQAAIAEPDSLLQLREVIKPENSVQWALYYQPLIYALYNTNEATGNSALPTISTVGDIAEFLQTLQATPLAARDEAFYLYRASLYLAVGQLSEAVSDIDSAYEQNPASGGAMALQSIVALTNNEPDIALQLAELAVANEPSSSAALLALSYAKQAVFAIDDALAHALDLTIANPDNPLAWARVAELWLSKGDHRQAIEAAERAIELNPDIERPQTVLGFANLVTGEFAQATARFDTAASLDSTAPLPRLGRGLVLIRQGRLKTGREELEVAVSLDPANALLRSYLGKAYFEERRSLLPDEQFSLARQFDPSDPTAYYYDAIQKQFNHQPAAALKLLDRAIDLNDRRAVYRSRLLLDQDRAARGVSLAQLYENLGFRKLAINAASKSLAEDSSNYSAHRFLSDTYAQFDRREIARSSALLQSQLLQPVNISPVTPGVFSNKLDKRLTEGAGKPSLNEYTSLFESDGYRVVGNLRAGTQDTLASELLLSGINQQWSYHLGQFHYESDGFRDNNDIENQLYNAFVQYEISHSLGVQAELRYQDSSQGDITRNFNFEDFQTSDRRDDNESSARLGVRNNIRPGMTLISSLMYLDREVESSSKPDPALLVNDQSKADGYDGQAQLLVSGKKMDFIVGGGWYSVDNRQTIETLLSIPELGTSETLSSDEIELNTRQLNAYMYSDFIPTPTVDVQFGASVDHVDDGRIDITDINAKLATSWSLSDKSTLRAAVFSTTKRALVADQTLEPTQMVGFNQFFDDPNGTQSAVYGVGVDTELFTDSYAGIEFFERDLSIPVVNSNPLDQKETTASAYFYTLLNSRWSLTIEPGFEQIKSDRTRIEQINTLGIPLAVRYFSPTGFYGAIELNLVDQEVQSTQVSSVNDDELITIDQNDDFSVTNISVGYKTSGWRGQFLLEIRNVFDQSFNYQDLNPFRSEPGFDSKYSPERQVFATIQLNF